VRIDALAATKIGRPSEECLMSTQRNAEPGPLASLVARVTSASKHTARRSVDARVRAWHDSLPEEIKTDALEHDDPEALSQIAREWGDRRGIKALFHRLIYQNKLAPRTYSLEVLDELVALRQYAVVVVHRESANSVWDHVYDTRF
jgi:hypothetical protein